MWTDNDEYREVYTRAKDVGYSDGMAAAAATAAAALLRAEIDKIYRDAGML